MELKAVSSGVEGRSKTLKPGATQTTTMRGGEGKKRQKKKKENDGGVAASYKKREKGVEGTSRYEGEDENQEMKERATSPTKKPKKRPRDEVEEVVDPSIMVKKPRLEKEGESKKSKGDLAKTKTNKSGGNKTDIDKFKDSRGAGGRRLLTSRRTQDALIGFPLSIQENGRKTGIRYTQKKSWG